jgi:hypothetical protein
MRKLTGFIVITLIAALLATGVFADLRQGNMREKDTCAIPAFDCVYTQAGWHKTYGTWYVYGQWSDGFFSEYFGFPFGICCDSVVYDIYLGGGFGYLYQTGVPETITIDFLVANADIFFREVSGCCLPLGDMDLVARYTVPTDIIWPATHATVYGCVIGDYESMKVTLDPPLTMDADCNYYVAYYANGDDTVRLWATIDMLCGRDSFPISFDAGASYEGWYWFNGTVASGMCFEFRGEILECACLCELCAMEGWDILYDQVSKHSFSNENVYGGLSHGGGAATFIMGQSFNYQWDGCVKCIGVGGLFGGFQGEYDIPENLIVELWCWSTQEGWEPMTLLRRWIVPTSELWPEGAPGYGLDPEGYPLLNFFTEDYPGPYQWCDTVAPGGCVWATDDRPFLFVAYSDGPDTAPFLWFTDMCKGYCSFSGSDDCEFTWIHNYYWGDPEAGEPEANMSFILCGGCTEVCAPVEGDEVVDSGYLAGPLFGQPQGGYPGWVWFSIPIDPADCCDAEDCYDPNTLLGFDAGGALFYWDKYGKFQQVYQPPFTVWPLEVGQSYLFYMNGAVPNPCYEGINPYVSSRRAGGEPRFYGYDYGVMLGKMGWTWVGLPGMKPIYGGGSDSDFGNKVRVMYPALPDYQGGEGVARTAAEDYAATPGNWVQWGWSYYDTFLQAPKTFTFYAPFGNNDCFPWIGYRLWVNIGTADQPYNPATGDGYDQAVLIWPAPECYEGTFPPQ